MKPAALRNGRRDAAPRVWRSAHDAKGLALSGGEPVSVACRGAGTPEALGADSCNGSGQRRFAVRRDDAGVAGADTTLDVLWSTARAATTRNLRAALIVGSGTVSKLDQGRSDCFLANKRSLLAIASGAPTTPPMAFGGTVGGDVSDERGAIPPTHGLLTGEIDARP